MKVLILKTGHSETLDPEISQTTSLGDVLRSTVILHPFKDEHITWVTDKTAYPLLYGIPCISRILLWDFETAIQLLFEKYDIVINLEKSPVMCALTSKIDAWQKYGFRFDDIRGEAHAFKESTGAFRTYIKTDAKKQSNRPWQEILYEMIGSKWFSEPYLLGIKPRTKMVSGRIGLNHKIGGKFPEKAWPFFSELSCQGVSWQFGDNLQDYVDWLNSCEVVVTNDSLGLHLSIALGRKFVALFGPTNPHEVFDYGLGVKLTSQDGDMSNITVSQVEKEVEKLLNGGLASG